MSTFQCKNQKSLRALIEEQKSPVEVIESPKTGKLFFTCGSIRGYISKKLQSVYRTTGVNDVQYAEVITDAGESVPTLFLRGHNNVKKTWE